MPCTSYTLMALQVVVGVLTKYVNLGKGWRHRLFVLKNGVLQYYKVTAAAIIWSEVVCDGSLIPACMPVHCSQTQATRTGPCARLLLRCRMQRQLRIATLPWARGPMTTADSR